MSEPFDFEDNEQPAQRQSRPSTTSPKRINWREWFDLNSEPVGKTWNGTYQEMSMPDKAKQG